jgi:hypothetical protein
VGDVRTFGWRAAKEIENDPQLTQRSCHPPPPPPPNERTKREQHKPHPSMRYQAVETLKPTHGTGLTVPDERRNR